MRRLALGVPLVSFVVACSSDSTSAPDAGGPDGSVIVDGATDSKADVSTLDAAPRDGSTSDASVCVDPCPAPNGGITLVCEKRFYYGENYPWKNFATDFGGLATWNEVGIAAAPAGYLADLQTMKADGADVIRWWLFPDFRGDGITFNGSDLPTGIGSTAPADIEKALELADQADVFIQFNFFSFDAFNPTKTADGVTTRSIAPIASSAANTAMLVSNVVRPIVKAATASAHANRIAAWEIINEPEWAVTGTDPYGDPAFTPNSGLTTLPFAEMETFIQAISAGIAAETTSAITVGTAAPKWAKAWSHASLTFYEWHYYDWINEYWPYTNAPSTYGVTVPVVVGEMPNSGFTQPSVASFDTVMTGLSANGFAGAMGWALTDNEFGSPATLQAYASANACTTHYTLPQALLLPPPQNRASEHVVISSFRNRRRCTSAAHGIPTCSP